LERRKGRGESSRDGSRKVVAVREETVDDLKTRMRTEKMTD